MAHAWRRPSRGDGGVPIEMRFVDMFMAALGALVFLAMLLAFLLRFVPVGPTASHRPGADSEVSRLELVTKQVPKAIVGERYDFSLAYRGGVAPVHWELAAGSQEFKDGLIFDSASGSVRGTPGHVGRISFVVRVWDASNRTDERAYDLAADESPKSRQKLDTTLAVVMLGAVCLLLLMSVGGLVAQNQMLRQLREAHALGQSSVGIEVGPGVTERVDLPEGIPTYEGRARFLRGLSGTLLAVVLILSGWFVFRLWLSS